MQLRSDSNSTATPEKTDLPTDMEGAPGTDPKHGRIVEENVAAQELKTIGGEEYVAKEALAKDEVQPQKWFA